MPADREHLSTKSAIASTLGLLFDAYDFSTAERILARVEPAASPMLAACRAFSSWDRFEHDAAASHFAPIAERFSAHLRFLDAIRSSRAFLEGAEREPWIDLVDDLLLNAERCAVRNRFDDAVGRLYRAAELLVQSHLLARYAQRTADLDLARLPEEARGIPLQNPRGHYCTAVVRSYELLAFFPQDPLWPLYLEQKEALLRALEIRNQSLFAHGVEPIRSADYHFVRTTLGNFVEEALRRAWAVSRFAVQFPRNLSDVWKEER